MQRDGGAIAIDSIYKPVKDLVSCSLESCVFSNNSAAKHGGAIRLASWASMTLTSCAFSTNRAKEVREHVLEADYL